MLRFRFARWLTAPPLNGRIALLSAILALSLATLIRALIDPVVTGCEVMPYLPFVVVCGALLPWWEASMVALAAVPILGLSFIGTPAELAASSCFQSSSGIFLAASASMICPVGLARPALVATLRS